MVASLASIMVRSDEGSRETREDDDEVEKSKEDEGLSSEAASSEPGEPEAAADEGDEAVEASDGADDAAAKVADDDAPKKRRSKSLRPAQRSAALPEKQATSVRGTALGLGAWIVLSGLGWFLVPEIRFAGTSERLAYAASLLPFSGLVLALGVGVTALTRYTSDAIDPLARAERGPILVHTRFVDNTTQQLALHVIAVMGLAADGSPASMRLIPGLIACFVVGRAAFWIGYLKDAMSRGPGFAMTLYPTVCALLWVAGRGAYAFFSR